MYYSKFSRNGYKAHVAKTRVFFWIYGESLPEYCTESFYSWNPNLLGDLEHIYCQVWCKDLYQKHSQSFLLIKKHRTWSSCNESVKWIPIPQQGKSRNGKEMGGKIFKLEGKMHRGEGSSGQKNQVKMSKCFLLSNEIGACKWEWNSSLDIPADSQLL